MTEPHEVLGVEPSADPEAVRARYLELVRLHPPEKDAERFSEIHAAYQRMMDPEERLNALLFGPPNPEVFDQVFGAVCDAVKRTRPTTAALREMAAALDKRI